MPNHNSHDAIKLHWLARERVLLYPAFVIIGLFAVFFTWWTARSFPSLIDPLGKPVGYDFIAFWSAARLAVDGCAQCAYDWQLIAATHQLAVPGYEYRIVRWHYPPTYLLVIFFLGFLPYIYALVVFYSATTFFWGSLIRSMFADRRAWIVAAAFPAGLQNFGDGQNGFLTAGLAGFSLLTLDRRPILAGFLIGLLAIKPHLAILFPLALIAGRRWITFWSAVVTTIGFAGLSLWVFGWSTMQAFLHNLEAIPDILRLQQLKWSQIPSVYAFALGLGANSAIATIVHGIVAVTAAVSVWIAWRIKNVPNEVKFSILPAASLLISPYIFFYDFTWIGLSLAWLTKLGVRSSFREGEREFLAAIWLSSGFIVGCANFLNVQLGWLLPLGLTLLASWRALNPNRENTTAENCLARL